MEAIQLRRLTADDAYAFRTLRLDALERFPDSYTSTLAEESLWPTESYARFLDTHLACGAEMGGALIATAIAERPEKIRLRHRCHLSAVYVVPEHQHHGIGRKLLTFLLQRATDEGFERAMLATDSVNESAIRLYRSLGFTEYGIDSRALKENGRYLDDLLMSCPLPLTAISER